MTRKLFDRWNSGNHTIDPELIDPEINLDNPLTPDRTTPYHGYAGIQERIDEVEGQFEDWRLELDDVRELDENRVLASGVLHAKGRGSDIHLDQPVEWLLTFRDGRLLRYELFADEEENPAGVE